LIQERRKREELEKKKQEEDAKRLKEEALKSKQEVKDFLVHQLCLCLACSLHCKWLECASFLSFTVEIWNC